MNNVVPMSPICKDLTEYRRPVAFSIDDRGRSHHEFVNRVEPVYSNPVVGKAEAKTSSNRHTWAEETKIQPIKKVKLGELLRNQGEIVEKSRVQARRRRNQTKHVRSLTLSADTFGHGAPYVGATTKERESCQIVYEMVPLSFGMVGTVLGCVLRRGALGAEYSKICSLPLLLEGPTIVTNDGDNPSTLVSESGQSLLQSLRVSVEELKWLDDSVAGDEIKNVSPFA
ncbi:hypothetical protein Scep_029397 [Stephania cephalantha]|uniref:Uncharacterized protein n=1 Tax=Stephania cephalantha TaxID=152367 RepID=A0AAP0DXS3_9MAGN